MITKPVYSFHHFLRCAHLLAKNPFLTTTSSLEVNESTGCKFRFAPTTSIVSQYGFHLFEPFPFLENPSLVYLLYLLNGNIIFIPFRHIEDSGHANLERSSEFGVDPVS